MNPWDFDYVLDEQAVRALAAQCGLRGSVQTLGSGWDYATFLCDGHVLRIPKRTECAEALPREQSLLQALPMDLPLQVPRPRRKLVSGPGLPYPCQVYPFIAGSVLESVYPHAWQHARPNSSNILSIAAAVGGFLRPLHAFQDAEPRVGEIDLTPWTIHALARLEWLRSHLDAPTHEALRRRLSEPTPPIMSSVVFTHNDLSAEHILLNENGRAVAIIDWGDAGRAPWWFDLTGLWMWGGDAALVAALDAYGRTPSREERLQMRRQALLAAINNCDDQLHRDVPGQDPTRRDAWSGLVQRYLQRWI